MEDKQRFFIQIGQLRLLSCGGMISQACKRLHGLYSVDCSNRHFTLMKIFLMRTISISTDHYKKLDRASIVGKLKVTAAILEKPLRHFPLKVREGYIYIYLFFFTGINVVCCVGRVEIQIEI